MPLIISNPGENWRNCASVTLKKGASERLFHIGVACYLVLLRVPSPRIRIHKDKGMSSIFSVI